MQDGSSPILITSFSLNSSQNSKTVQVTLEVQDDEGTWTTHEGKMTKTYTIRRGQDRHFYLKDHLGSVRVTVNEAGEPIGFDDYYPYGLQMPTRSSNSSNLNDAYKYTGHERDTEIGLTFDYMGARIYDPLPGTLMQIDPLAAKFPSYSPYNYTLNNPINMWHPDGRAPIGCCIFAPMGTSITATTVKAMAGDKDAQVALKAVHTANVSVGLAILPGPEDVALGAFVATKIGRAVANFGDKAWGAVKGLFKSGDEVANFASLSKTVDPNQVRFSQSSIKSEFQNGGSIDDLVKGLQDGSIDPSSVPSIRITEKDGNILPLTIEGLKHSKMQVYL